MVKRRPGFTLIEVLTTTVISTVVALVIALTFNQAWTSYANGQDISQLERDNRQTLSQITDLARLAFRVVATVTINGSTYTSDGTNVVLRLNPIDGNGTFLTSGDDYVVLRRRPGSPATTERLVLTTNAGGIRAAWPTSLILNNYTSVFTVKYYNAFGTELIPGTDDLTTAKELTFQSRITKTTGSKTNTQLLEASVYLRNKGL